jgi:hypothetical protein
MWLPHRANHAAAKSSRLTITLVHARTAPSLPQSNRVL